MHNTHSVVFNKYSRLTAHVELADHLFPVSDYSFDLSLYRYLQKSPVVFLKTSSGTLPVGKIDYAIRHDITVDLLDNSAGGFVQHMLYRAVDYKILAFGLGQVTNDTLEGFRISHLLLTDYVKWF